MYTIRREGDGVVIVPPVKILNGVYIPVVANFAYRELEKLVELANVALDSG